MQPTGAQLARLQDALLSAYPTLADLRPMVRIELEASLDAVVPLHGQTQTAILFDLIEHYAAQPGGLHRLLRAALAGNPDNPALKSLAPEFLASDFDPLPVRKQRADILWVNVPAKPAEPLLGRDNLLSDLATRLLAGHSPALSTDGLPGVGKTALAVALAHDERVRAHFTDGVLWGGLGVNPDVVTIQNQWATAVGMDLADEPDVHKRAQRLSAAVGDRRVLVVIDDAWEVAAAQALRLASPNVVHLLTSRDRKIARDFAGAGQQVHVPELEAEPAFALLLRLAPEACKADAEAARRLVKMVGELPLAIEVLGGYLAAPVLRKAQVGALAAMGDAKRRLALAAERLGGQPGKRETLDAVIRLSVAALPEEATAVFWALGAFAPKPATFDLSSAETVTGAGVDVLDLLAQRNLVEVADGNTLTVHQVVHDVMARATPGEAAERHTKHYLEIVYEDRENWRRIERAYEQVRFACNRGDIMHFVNALSIFQARRGIWKDRLAWLETALIQVRADSDAFAEAHVLHEYGYAYHALGEKQAALECYEQSLPLRRHAMDKSGEADTLSNLGSILDEMGSIYRAKDCYDQALILRRTINDKIGEATILNNLGKVHFAGGDLHQAINSLEAAMAIRIQFGDNEGQAAILANFGAIYSSLGEKHLALQYYEQALAQYRQTGDVGGEAVTLNNIGKVHSDLSNKQEALHYLEASLELSRQTGDAAGEGATLNNIGGVYDRAFDRINALRYYELALILFRRTNDLVSESIALTNIGTVHNDIGDQYRALDYYEQALKIQREVDDKTGMAFTLLNAGILLLQLGRQEYASTIFQEFLEVCSKFDERVITFLGLTDAITDVQIVISAMDRTSHRDSRDRSKDGEKGVE